MDNGLFSKARRYLQEHKKQSRWKRLITVMASLIVFCTTYILILPAITMVNSNTAYCGLDVHVHQPSCYIDGVLMCGMQEHTHTDSCYDDGSDALLDEGEIAYNNEEDDWYTGTGNTYRSNTQTGATLDNVTGLIEGEDEEELFNLYSEDLWEEIEEESETESESDTEIQIIDPEPVITEESEAIENEIESEAVENEIESEAAETEIESEAVETETEATETEIESEAVETETEAAETEKETEAAETEIGSEAVEAETEAAETEIETEAAETEKETEAAETEEETEAVSEEELESVWEEETEEESEEELESVWEEELETEEETEAESEEETEAEEIVKTFDGEDYHIKVTYTQEANLPEDVELTAEEILGEAYEEILAEAKAAMGLEEISFARFFDVTFLYEGEEVEPEAPVKVEIVYDEAYEQAEEEIGNVVHFTEEGTEVLDMEVTQLEDGGMALNYEQNSFSAVGTVFGLLGAPAPSRRHPQAAITGEPMGTSLTLYNVDASYTDTVSGLAGVEYTIYDSNGTPVRTMTTTSDVILHLGTLTDGNYTIRQTHVPAGYVDNAETRKFTVSGGAAFIGMFYNFRQGTPGYSEDKTAEVVDYINRTYKVTLAAASGKYKFNIRDIKYQLVVDQSNSMLFPSELTPVTQVWLYQLTDGDGYKKRNGYNLDQLVAQGKLDINKVYYVIADESVSSTVFAIWNDGKGWCYQDAAYYSKAWMHEHGIEHNAKEAGDYVYFAEPDKGYSYNADGYNRTGGGGLDYLSSDGKTGVGSTLGKEFGSGKYMTLYEGSTYNRLHDLQQAVVIFGSQLGSLNQNASLDLITFDKEVESCVSISKLDGAGIQKLINAVDNITTLGGTRQDHALNHVIGKHGGTSGSSAAHTRSHIDTSKGNIVILITDGAPVGATPDACISVGNEVKRTNGVELLVTVGLSTKNVTGGTYFLRTAASDGYYYESEKAGELTDILMRNILLKFGSREWLDDKADIEDVISESFYPIDPKTNAPLTSGTKIALDGTVNAKGAGTVLYDSRKGWYVRWDDQVLGNPLRTGYTEEGRWHGNVYLKAKEDFIGGNAIDTNKRATVTPIDEEGRRAEQPIELASPNVNVRLLPFAGAESEETVFLGDSVENLREKMQTLLHKTVFTKLVPGEGDVLNKVGASESQGCFADNFTIPYAIGNLTDAQWEKIKTGQEVSVDYTYDDPSSHGAVGYFTFKLSKTGALTDVTQYSTRPDQTPVPENEKDAYVGYEVAAYTLNVTYTAYRIGETDQSGYQRAANVHNSDAGPGTEVAPNLNTDLPHGKGTEETDEIHHVHVVDGKITVSKEITELLKADADQIFRFKLYKKASNEWSNRIDTVNDKLITTLEVTVPAGSTKSQALAEIGHLPRGTYYLVEDIAENEEAYYLESARVEDPADAADDPADCDEVGKTNCKAQKAGEDNTNEQAVFFHIGYTAENADVIERSADPQKDSALGRLVYSIAKQNGQAVAGTNDADYHNISRGNAVFVNAINQLPIQKIWGDVKDHENDVVYAAVIDENGSPKTTNLDGEVRVILVELKKSNLFKTDIRVAKADISGFKVAEASGLVKEPSPEIDSSYTKAIVINADIDEMKKVCYQTLIEEGEDININGSIYQVTYSSEDDGTITVTNTPGEMQLLLQKVNMDKKPLNEAQFELFRDAKAEEAGAVELTIGQETVYGVKMTNQETGADIYVSQEGTIEIDGNPETVQGLIQIPGMTEGIYYLEETKAPAGYNLLTEPVKIVINKGKATYYYKGKTLESGIRKETSGEMHTITVENTALVPNTAGHELPQTGGPGTKGITAAGWMLIIIALLCGYRMRRRMTSIG